MRYFSLFRKQTPSIFLLFCHCFLAKVTLNCCEMNESSADKQEGGGEEGCVTGWDWRSEIHHPLLKVVTCSRPVENDSHPQTFWNVSPFSPVPKLSETHCVVKLSDWQQAHWEHMKIDYMHNNLGKILQMKVEVDSSAYAIRMNGNLSVEPWQQLCNSSANFKASPSLYKPSPFTFFLYWVKAASPTFSQSEGKHPGVGRQRPQHELNNTFAFLGFPSSSFASTNPVGVTHDKTQKHTRDKR